MKDIPIFTTQYGVASLALGKIPYGGCAYIHVRSVAEGMLDAHVNECADFCRAVGAEHIFWTAEEAHRPPHSIIYEMRGHPPKNPDLLACLFPVTEQTAAKWRQIHNERMQQVDHAAYLTAADEKKLLNPGAYFIHREGKLLGIGWLEDDCIRALAAVEPGAGETVARTLLSLTEGTVRLEVVSTNTRAIRLYEKLGFVKTRELRRWYQV